MGARKRCPILDTASRVAYTAWLFEIGYSPSNCASAWSLPERWRDLPLIPHGRPRAETRRHGLVYYTLTV
jgi:hypothetical protein